MKNVSSVTINDFDGGYKATKHLIETGCKRIAYLSGDTNIEIFKDSNRNCSKFQILHSLIIRTNLKFYYNLFYYK